MFKSLLHRPKKARGSAKDSPPSNPGGGLAESSTQQPNTQRVTPLKDAGAPFMDEYGIKVLYQPERPRVDIVFVHGLTGRQLSTWTIPGAAAPWPQVLLAEDIPDARISAFGYDADVVNLLGPAGQNRIRHHAANLIRGVADMWLESGTAELPITFVAHSLGGLVCENALTIADHAEQHEKQILEYTRAIAFLGTPHRGSDLASWGTIAGNMLNLVKRTNTNIVGILQPDSEVLENVTQGFHTMLRSRERANGASIQITCFVEELPVTRAGKSFLVVPSKSAILERYPYVTIHADHIDMTKFEGRNNDYKNVFLQLKRWTFDLSQSSSRLDRTVELSMVKDRIDVNGYWLLPFSRDKYFVDRPDITNRLWDIFSAEAGARAALIGIGGIGKSQIAIEFAYRLRSKSPLMHIFWVHANDPEQFRQSYRNIAGLLQLPGFDDPKTDVLNLLHVWLSRELNGPWLMILDNMDDDGFVDARQGACGTQYEFTVRKYLPQREGGSILITSRDRSAAFRLVNEAHHLLEVRAMTAEEASAILNKRLDNHLGSDEERSTLATTLERIPLALTQAAAYINRRPRMTIARYLDILNQDEEGGVSLLQIEESDLRRSEGVPNSVVRTWQITFDQIRAYHKSAVDLLVRMVLFDRKGIPEFLLRAAAEEIDFDEAIDILIGFALVTAEVGGTYFEMHRLVQVSTIVWLRYLGDLEEQKKFAVDALAKCYPAGRFENWTTCQLLEPHALSLLKHGFSSDGARMSRAQVQRNRASYYIEQGNFGMAEQYAKQSMDDASCILGDEHPSTLISMGNLATTYRDQGRWKEAEELEVQVMKTRKRVLDDEHPDTLTSMGNLAWTYWNQGRWKKAEELEVRVMEAKKRVLGDEHPDTLISMGNLALTYSNQGRWKEAEELGMRVMETRKRVLGDEHPATLTSIHNLAFAYEAMGGKDEAIQLMKTAARLREKVLGPDHPHTKLSASTLASWMQL